MEGFWAEIFRNGILWVTLLSWVIAQGIKIIIGLCQGKKFNFYWILRTGGMPSAHSAAVAALTFAIGKNTGFSSPLFALSTILALITMFDAQTWRRSIGVQARILNRIMEDIQEKKKIEEKKLKELAGHTPVEVFVGALIGIIIPLLFYN
ncbi:MAG: divergent PAP2 family protein [Candidatus Omnitrophica bacterium]|nr:divergent PAP2 family protein [Candidatus Omnitrophota bacterium]MBU0878022.1 divergent PAP2 family protein [Candidatus Omnitrophota bacterium]MBU0896287.1 divergent PAP2 family protein [Candidatus Omnitrophota bacterium]MBU1133874.1 divergent PAP2 family protein [Candidatus Omnitrophota bacterium]MBU1367231.1 divergent PAP2 family protein [Candidatus Omnitrophota bacterium]